MTDFERNNDNDEDLSRNGETPADAAPAPGEFSAAADQTPRQERTDSTYDPEYPTRERSAYSDAGYVPSDAASAVPRSYHCAAPTERKPKREKQPRRGMGAAGVIALCLVCALLGGVAGGFAPKLFAETPAQTDGTLTNPDGTVINVASPTATPPVTTNLVETGKELSATEIYYNLALKQTVGVTTEVTYTNIFGYTSSGAVSGSGFIISTDGYILTNYHVIENAVKGGYTVNVLNYDGEKYEADIVGYEEDNDVAILKIDAGKSLSAATIGDSDGMVVGDKVYAVGNPLGELEYTMTDGMVSALDREISTTDSSTGRTKTINMFQISAAINSGNSGGPVYNSRGEVIGISTAKYSDTGVEGLGFAIPIKDAIKIAGDLISDGYVRGKAYMGVQVGTVTASAAQYYGLVEGAIVAVVNEGGCAEKAGLRESDIIVAIDDTEVVSRDDLINAKKNYSAGDTATLKVYRGGEYIELSITFDEETPEILAAESEKAAAEQQQQQQQQSSGSFGGYGSYNDFFNHFFGGNPFGN